MRIESCCISLNAQRFAIKTTCSHRGAYRTHVNVMEGNDMLYTTKDYYVYDMAFNTTGEKLLMVAEKRKPFAFDLITQAIVAEMPKQVRLYKGDLDKRNDVFWAPCEKAKNTCYLFSFETGATTTVKMGTQALINRLRIADDQERIYLVTENNILYCVDRDYKTIWSTDFNQLGRINSSDIFMSEDGKLLCVYSTSTETNKWGAEYVVDSESGAIVHQIENYQYRGRVGEHYFGNKLLTHRLTTLDLLSGEVAESGLI